jgi:hypothetical protein
MPMTLVDINNEQGMPGWNQGWKGMHSWSVFLFFFFLYFFSPSTLHKTAIQLSENLRISVHFGINSIDIQPFKHIQTTLYQ